MFGNYKSSVLSSTPYHSYLGIYPTWSGYLTAQRNYECKPRVLDDYFLIYVSSGEGQFGCKGNQSGLKKSDLFFLFPGVVHWYRTHPEHLLELWWIGFNGPNAQMLTSNLGISPENPLIRAAQNNVQDIIRETVNDMMEVHSGTVLKASGNLYRLFGTLMDSRQKQEVQEYGPADGVRTKSIEKALAFIDANYSHDISITQIARHTGLSRSHFATRFKEEVGYSPSEHLARMRLKQAKHYLENSDLSIREIAASVGFTDPQYFSRFFHQSEGVSPTDYRSISSSRKKDAEHGSKTAI